VDAELVEQRYEAAVRGDQDAVRSIVEAWSRDLVRLAVVLGLPPTDAEDAVHAAWMKFFRHLREAAADPTREMRDPSKLRAWLRAVTRNSVRDIQRSTRRRRDLVHRAGIEALSSGAFVFREDHLSRLANQERIEAMWYAIRDLDETCRTIIVLRLEDPPCTYAEISEMIGRPEGAIGPTLGRCIDKLRRALEVGSDHD
jgi:RNA polymerase sigma factor (sigma-70 family)